MPKTRTFIAVPAVDGVEGAALSVVDRLRSAAEGVKWVAPGNLHWTLHFLGDLTDQEMAEVCLRTVRAAAQCEGFVLRGRGVGAFPSLQRPRTIWLGADDGGDEMRELYSRLFTAIESLGFRRESRPYVPHLTLGRADAGRHERLATRLASLADYDGGTMEVDEVVVYGSELTRDGPEYTVLARAPLA